MHPHADMRLGAQTNRQVEWLVVAGGAPGGTATFGSLGRGGGGGAGGMRDSATEGPLHVDLQAYAITVGGPTQDSSIGSLITCLGGGNGASPLNNGGNGGSGGGGGNGGGLAGSGTPGQGNDGSDEGNSGGGAGASGALGGAGRTNSLRTGAPVTYALGGAEGGGSVKPANSGWGGDGADGPGSIARTSGASGIVVIGYLTGTMTATGGTVTTVGPRTIHTFLSSGTFTVTG